MLLEITHGDGSITTIDFDQLEGLRFADDNGRSVWIFGTTNGGGLEISTSGCACVKGVRLDAPISVRPVDSNRVILLRERYE